MLEVEDKKHIGEKIKNWKVNILNPKHRGIHASGKKFKHTRNSNSRSQDE